MDFSQFYALAITGVMLIPLFPWEYQPWGEGSHEHFSTMRARYFQILQTMGEKISAGFLHTQKGIGSAPVAVFFKCVKQFHTCLSVSWELRLHYSLPNLDWCSETNVALKVFRNHPISC